ncbi:tRNA lysidine(34) synthetase TilS, partial [Methylobrevis pamukkalensis]|uniref:tRNA lysidine(34) synthetase TilS n=1 Tax=Methylobrevis pamukkalensis TaxID=1439726 RepID=UPI00084621C7
MSRAPRADAPDTASPIGPAEADRLFSPFSGLSRIAVAVSGGADSTGLLHLLSGWSARTPDAPALQVLTVDHGLRPAAAEEAARVAELAAALSLPCEILRWHTLPPTGDIQAAARAARYRLLAEATRRAGIGHVLLAHHRDDVAETFLIRLARGSGLRGLSAMPARREVDGIVFHRPLLAVPRARLVATLDAAGLGWSEDPSNTDPRYLRSRVRMLMPALADLGIDAARLSDTAGRLGRAAALVDRLVGDLRGQCVEIHAGYASLALPALNVADPELRLRLVSDLLRDLCGADYGPRLAALEAALAAVTAADDGSGRGPVRRTLGGMVLDRRGGMLWLYREAGRTGLPVLDVAEDGVVRWDGRLDVRIEGLAGRARPGW